jgi:hypothetical protein
MERMYKNRKIDNDVEVTAKATVKVHDFDHFCLLVSKRETKSARPSRLCELSSPWSFIGRILGSGIVEDLLLE